MEPNKWLLQLSHGHSRKLIASYRQGKIFKMVMTHHKPRNTLACTTIHHEQHTEKLYANYKR